MLVVVWQRRFSDPQALQPVEGRPTGHHVAGYRQSNSNRLEADDPEQLFGDERCTPAILEFLAQADVGSTARLQAGRFWEDREE
jgi:hypothetical protein